MNSVLVLEKTNYEINNAVQQSIEIATKVINDYTCKNSLSAYTHDLIYWNRWAKENGITLEQGLKKEHLIMYIIHHSQKHKMSTIKRRISSMSKFLQLNYFPNPCRDKDILILLRKLTEKNGCSKAWGKAITLQILNDMLDTCENDGIIGTRDAALLLFGFATGGRRRSEISSAVMENLRDNHDGTFTYNIGKSKTNQSGQYDPRPIMGRAARYLKKWMQESNVKDGSIFRALSRAGKVSDRGITDKQVSRIVKIRCKKAGYDPTEYTAHSLRSGFVTESGKKGKPIGDVMAMTGHRSMKEVMRYYQSGDIMNNSTALLSG